jgi:putative ABC transport system permease protein
MVWPELGSALLHPTYVGSAFEIVRFGNEVRRMFGIPLAWLQLVREKMRLLVALAGIGFAVILMFIQLGFRDALFESSVTLHQQLQGDIFLISPQSTSLIAMRSFSQRRLYQAYGFDGVESIAPMYLGFGIWKNPETRATRQIMVMGFDPSEHIFPDSMLPDIRSVLEPDYVLFDEASRPEFGAIKTLFQQSQKTGTPVETEVDGHRVKIGGLFKLGASFGADGNLATSDINFRRMFSKRKAGLIDVGIVRIKAGADRAGIVSQLKQELEVKNSDIRVLTKEEFISFERSYWESSTAIGFIFNLGAGIGWIVGMVIVYQILYTDVADHLAEYATLKAMGYRNLYLLNVVFQESIILSILGYIPAFFLSTFLYDATQKATSLPLKMTQDRGILVFCLTIAMCVISGAIAVRKVQDADPADIF